MNDRLKIEKTLTDSRNLLLDKLQLVFIKNAISGHIFGSTAKGNSDSYSDLDIWLTFDDDSYGKIFEKRFDLYEDIGEIISICEAPQNAPASGVHSALLFMINGFPVMADVYLCPTSSSFITSEGYKLFGIDLPVKKISGYNPQKVNIPEDYRINFLIGIIFNSIKKIVREDQQPLAFLISEYNKLKTNYSIDVKSLKSETHNFDTLREIVSNTSEMSNSKQTKALNKIKDFINKIDQ